jgi:hypothetical protein
MFRAHRTHHQERQIVSIQPLVAVTLCRWLCRVQIGSKLATCTWYGHWQLPEVILTQFVSPDDEHDVLKTCRVKNKNKYIEKNCSSRWSFTKLLLTPDWNWNMCFHLHISLTIIGLSRWFSWHWLLWEFQLVCRVRVLAICTLVSSIAVLLMGSVKEFWHLVLLRMLLAAGWVSWTQGISNFLVRFFATCKISVIQNYWHLHQVTDSTPLVQYVQKAVCC